LALLLLLHPELVNQDAFLGVVLVVADVHELLTSGTSPLYNPNLPADDLYTNLARARAGISADSTA